MDRPPDAAYQSVLEALVARRMEESLGRVEEALRRWRSGEIGPLAAHGEVLRHAARASALSSRIGRVTTEGADRMLRDAVDAGVLSREEFVKLVGRQPEEIEPLPSLDDELSQEPPALPAKRAVLEKLLPDGPVLVHLDARRDGVRVPPVHSTDVRLVLRLGHSLTPPIPDLELEEDGVHATLSFRGAPYACVLPWSAIYAIASEDGRGLVWPDDVPPEVVRDVGETESKPGPRRPPSTSPPRRGHLKLV